MTDEEPTSMASPELDARETLTQAVFQKLEDGSIVGRVPHLKGIIAFGATQEQCANELCSVVEDWVRLRIQAADIAPAGAAHE